MHRLLILLLLSSTQAIAQSKWALSIITEYRQEAEVLNRMHYRVQHTDSATALKEVNRIVRKLQEEYYLLASADSLFTRNDSVLVWLHIGSKLASLNISSGNVPKEMVDQLHLQKNRASRKTMPYREWNTLSKHIITYAENHGYPFATVTLDSIQLEESQLRASIQYRSGPIISFDSLVFLGTARLQQRFLSTYLRITPHQPFSQSKVDNAIRLLKQVPYLKLNHTPSVVFHSDRAYLNIDASSRKISEFDGIVGFLPNQETPNKVLVTGEINLKLKNLFGSGKNIGLEWQQIRKASPVLHLEYEHPVLFKTNVNLKMNFDLLKEDTLFLNINRRITLSYPLVNAGILSVTTGLRTSRLSNSSQYKEEITLPALSDVSYLSYGLGYEWNTLDDVFYPKKGTHLTLQAEAGNKKIKRNPFVDQQIYQSISLNSLQLTVYANLQKYVLLSTRSVLLARLQAGNLSGEHLFANDLFRLGGLNSLRGFNQNFFYASQYATGTAEYRFFMDATSYLLLFFDQAWLSFKTVQSKGQDNPFGVGTGISFSTRTCVFNLIYSLGNSQNQKINLNLSKIHFGFISRF